MGRRVDGSVVSKEIAQSMNSWSAFGNVAVMRKLAKTAGMTVGVLFGSGPDPLAWSTPSTYRAAACRTCALTTDISSEIL